MNKSVRRLLVLSILIALLFMQLVVSANVKNNNREQTGLINTQLNSRHFSGFSLPKDLQRIENSAFEETAAEVIYLNEGLISIGKRAFAKSIQIKAVSVPDTVSYIGDDAFPHSQNLMIYGSSGSYAYMWAQENHYRIEVIDAFEAKDNLIPTKIVHLAEFYVLLAVLPGLLLRLQKMFIRRSSFACLYKRKKYIEMYSVACVFP